MIYKLLEVPVPFKTQSIKQAIYIYLQKKYKLTTHDLILRERRLPWFGHMERSGGAVRTACDIQIDGR